MGFSLKKMFSPVTKIVKKATGAVTEVVGQTWDGVLAVGGGIQNIGGAGVDVVQGVGGAVETLGKENPVLLAGIATGNPALLAAGTNLETQKFQTQQEILNQVAASRKLNSDQAQDNLFNIDEKYKPFLIYGGGALAAIVLYAIVKD